MNRSATRIAPRYLLFETKKERPYARRNFSGLDDSARRQTHHGVSERSASDLSKVLTPAAAVIDVTYPAVLTQLPYWIPLRERWHRRAALARHRSCGGQSEWRDAPRHH